MKIVITLFLFFFSFIATTTASGESAITIGVSLSLTGKYARMGDMQLKAYRLWEHATNQDGGILGKSVRILVADDQSEKVKAEKIYKDYIQHHKVDFVFGPYSSALTEIVAPIVEKHKYPMLVSGAASDHIWENGYQYIFGMWTPASRYVIGFLELLVSYNIDDIAIITADDSFSFGIAKGTKLWADRLGLNVIYIEKFKKGTRNLEYYVNIARQKGVRVLITTGHFNEALDTKKAFKAIGWEPELFFATVGPIFHEYYDQLQCDAERVFSISIWEPHPQLNYPGAQAFTRDFIEKYHINPTYHAATAFAAGEILVQAIEKIGSIDREKVREILSAMSTYSIIGRYGVDRTGLQIKRFPLCIQWQNGRKEIVWPEALSTAKPLINKQAIYP